MKIVLLLDIPVDPKHGLTQGKELKVLRYSGGLEEDTSGVWVMGDDGEDVRLHPREFKFVEEASDG